MAQENTQKSGMTPLFRNEAVNARRGRVLGDVILVRPVSAAFLTAVAVGLATTFVAFVFLGSYTRHTTIAGQLIPDTGLIKVFSPEPGIVTKKNVTEGQVVKKGDMMFVFTSDHQSATQGDVQQAISEQVESRHKSLDYERQKTTLLQQEESAGLGRKISDAQDEINKLDGEIELQRQRVKLSGDAYARYQGLLKQDFVSGEQTDQKQAELLDQRARLQNLERQRVTLVKEMRSQQSELASLSIKHQNQLSQIDRELTSVGQELTESEAKRLQTIAAPESGTVTAISAEVGQSIDASHPVVSIVPSNARMQAHLYAPSKAIGFVKVGDKVLLRYEGYPYQKFGHANGHVTAISRVALQGAELNENVGKTNANEPLYRITVELASQAVTAYGVPQPLQAGMLLDADVQQDTRRLYEWLLEPLYSVGGTL